MLRWCLLSAGKRLALLKPRYFQPFHGQVRGDSTWKNFVKPFRKKTREEYARSDGLNPAQDLLVYTSGVHNYMLLASITGTGILAGVVCYVVYFSFNPWPKTGTFKGRSIKVTFAQKMTFVFALATHMLGSFYYLRAVPIRIYYNKSQQMFNLVFQGVFPGLRRKLSFRPGALEPLYVDTNPIIMKYLGTLRVKNRWQRFVVFEERFHRTVFYNVLVGYDSVDVLED